MESVRKENQTDIKTPLTTFQRKRKNKIPSKKRKVMKDREKNSETPHKIPFKYISPSREKNDCNSFEQFRQLCSKISVEPSYNSKTEIIKNFFRTQRGEVFNGDLFLWVKLLLPGVHKRIYNLQSKTLIKIYSRILKASEKEMCEDLERGDVAETISTFYQRTLTVEKKVSTLKLWEVDEALKALENLTTEDKQEKELKRITNRCSVDDLKMLIRLIKGDLRIQAGAKHVLDALHPEAYIAFNTSRNMNKVLEAILKNPGKSLSVEASLMQPVQPMLAQPCKSIDMAFKKLSSEIYSEIKYDGERVQIHVTNGKEFQYFSRSLKPVSKHKVKVFQEILPKAFPNASDIILDAEVLLIDRDGTPLPFGTLGIHKKTNFVNANSCLFVFDIIYYNGQNLMIRPLSQRRQFLTDHMNEVENYVKFSEIKVIRQKEELKEMICEVLGKGLEGLVLKDSCSLYEPGKRHWLKIKKDCINDGSMADTADLVVLGAWFGTGNKGGKLSIFLMGCLDKGKSGKWRTVTKVHGGHDDATLNRLQGELLPNMIKIKGNSAHLPDWLLIHSRTMIPDFIVRDPKISPVWEITGAEFSKAETHSADGISIRFPRVSKIRDDKNWETATSLHELKLLFKASKEHEIIKKEPLSKTDEFVKETHKISNIRIIEGNLFDSKDSLAHIISKDFNLDKGIVKETFGRVKELQNFDGKVGEVAVLQDTNRFLYYLIIKEKMNDRVRIESLEKSLKSLRDHMLKHRVTAISLAKIELLADGLSWDLIQDHIQKIFEADSIQISIFSKNQKFTQEEFNLPDTFLGTKIALSDGVKDIHKMKRYIIAYGGQVSENEDNSLNVTHVVYSPSCLIKKKFGDDHVLENWLIDSIKHQMIQNTKYYQF